MEQLLNEDESTTLDFKLKQYPFENLIQVKNNFALCPFHNDKRPSFHIKDNKGRCFGCGWHGDTIQFLMDKEDLSFREAIEYLT